MTKTFMASMDYASTLLNSIAATVRSLAQPLGLASRTLKDHGMAKEADEMYSRVKESTSYHAALAVLMEYVNPVDANEQRKDREETNGMNMGDM